MAGTACDGRFSGVAIAVRRRVCRRKGSGSSWPRRYHGPRPAASRRTSSRWTRRPSADMLHPTHKAGRRCGMGLLVEGVWRDEGYDTRETGGRFVRPESRFRNWVTPDGSAGPSGEGGFKAEPGRYHLYVSLACPWAHRTLIFRKLKGLEEAIGVSTVAPLMLSQGWMFNERNPDHLYGLTRLYELHLKADPTYSGRVT